ncbi:hypothetical protein D6825_04055 [Candidatus Woesearchaeota archaeon]|nr:MAG: hypothetical protein D6825_04055 [Candidatus Woesearchaeota archaeon]
MAQTVLGNVIEFFKTLGVYDVLLPFLLSFTITFAILERTKIFGVEGKEGHTKKNLNAMVAFVTAFLVVASSKLVGIITKVSAELIVLLLLIVFFLMLVGTFYSKEDIEKKGVSLEGAWQIGFMVFIAIALLAIFLDALTTADGRTWLEVVWLWLASATTNTGVAAIVLIILLIIVMLWVMRPGKKGGSD